MAAPGEVVYNVDVPAMIVQDQKSSDTNKYLVLAILIMIVSIWYQHHHSGTSYLDAAWKAIPGTIGTVLTVWVLYYIYRKVSKQ